jgi:hypothetical protein
MATGVDGFEMTGHHGQCAGDAPVVTRAVSQLAAHIRAPIDGNAAPSEAAGVGGACGQ